MAYSDISVAVVGGGLVGSLATCLLAQRGFNVHLYEMRKDPRQDTTQFGRSINLALSQRGCEALRRAGLLTEVLQAAIPMRARMIHPVKGPMSPIPYGTAEQYINSVDRNQLNCILLSAAERYPNVVISFHRKLQSCNAESGTLQFKATNDSVVVEKKYDWILACDGAFSAVRQAVCRKERFNYEQIYLDHAYCEVPFPAKAPGIHALPKEYLHIWPRKEFMLIALPNADGTFTGTMFMPYKIFEGLVGPKELVEFYKTTFPDALNIIGEQKLIEGYFATKPLPLVSIKCSPYHFKNRVLLLGDAAHAMAPFFGQGMNCGMEDLLILDDLLNEYGTDIKALLPEFTRIRTPDAHAIVDLSMHNYVEMRDRVTSPLFLIRKKIDNFLYMIFPKLWCPLYTMVSFSRTPYSVAWASRAWQDKVLATGLNWFLIVAAGSALVAMKHTGVLARVFKGI